MANKIERLQNYIIGLLHSYSDRPLRLLTKDNCSELARFAGIWLLDEVAGTRVCILKGTGKIFGQQCSHDIVVFVDGDKIYLIDPSVWQFTPEAKSILITEVSSFEAAVNAAADYYGGVWSISDELKEASENEIENWKKIIRENIAELD